MLEDHAALFEDLQSPIKWYNFVRKEQKVGKGKECSVLTLLEYPARPVQLP